MTQYKNPAVALTADRYSYPIDCRRWQSQASFQLIGVETGAPVVKFKFQASDDPRVENDLMNGTYGTASETASWTLLTLPTTAVIHGLSAAATITLPDDEIDWNGTAALNLMVIFEPPPARIRLFSDWQSGGSAASLLTVYGADDSE